MVRAPKLLTAAVAVAIGLGGIAIFADLIRDVISGRGVDIFVSSDGYHVTAIGVFVLLAFAPILVLGGLLRGWLERREERDLLERYGEKRDKP